MNFLGGVIGGVLGVIILIVAALIACGIFWQVFFILLFSVDTKPPKQFRLGEQKWPPWEYEWTKQ